MVLELVVKYDRVADALYIRLKHGRISYSDEIARGIIVDYDENGEIVGIEILWFSQRKLDLSKLFLEGPEAMVATA